MSITRLDQGPRMSQAVVHGNTVVTAGQVAEGESVTAQTKTILDQIDDLLARAGTDKSKILSTTIWLTNIGDFAEMNAVWDAWVSEGNTPARACVESKLAMPKFLVEIQVTAAID